MISKSTLVASCVCGNVKYEAAGAPILGAVCYCDDCQQAGRQIAALSNATDVREPDGGTAYLLFRRDRFACVAGHPFLKTLRIKENSPTKRVVAGCCNSGMLLDFEKGHWVSVYRNRFGKDAPPLQMRIQTRFKPKETKFPDDLPTYTAFPVRFILKLAAARIAMLMAHRPDLRQRSAKF